MGVDFGLTVSDLLLVNSDLAGLDSEVELVAEVLAEALDIATFDEEGEFRVPESFCTFSGATFAELPWGRWSGGGPDPCTPV
jgi:hypothetical protein